MAQAYIVSAVRTAGGRRGGRLKGWHPADLAGAVIDGMLDRSGIDPALIQDVIAGCVSQVGEQSFNIGRGAVLSSRLPENVPGTTVDRQCGSSQQAVHFAAATVIAGQMDVVIAAGVESMTRVPMGLPMTLAAQHGYGSPLGRRIAQRYPGIIFSQFAGAEQMALKYELSKDELDLFSYQSHLKAVAATDAGAFVDEILPISVTLDDMSEVVHEIDEGIRRDASLDGIAGVRLIQQGGRLTAASASQICDGASALLIVNEAGLKSTGLLPLARIHQMTVTGGDPVIMLETPIAATRQALTRSGLSLQEIGLFEVNEAFASMPLAWRKALDADPARLNVNGGAIALGHPLGASGTRLMTTLVSSLRRTGHRYGLQTMCEAGGLANATIIERL